MTANLADQIWSRSGGKAEDKIRVEGLIWLAAKNVLNTLYDGDTFLDLSNPHSLQAWQQHSTKYLEGVSQMLLSKDLKHCPNMSM